MSIQESKEENQTPKLVYYRKVLINQPLVIGGIRVPFQHVGGSTGIIALDPMKDAVLIEGIEKLIAKRIGAVGRLTEKEYEFLKKNPPFRKFGRQSPLSEPLRVLPTQPSPFRQPRQGDPPGVVGPAADQGVVKARSMAAKADVDPAGSESEKPAQPFKPRTQRMQIKEEGTGNNP